MPSICITLPDIALPQQLSRHFSTVVDLQWRVRTTLATNITFLNNLESICGRVAPSHCDIRLFKALLVPCVVLTLWYICRDFTRAYSQRLPWALTSRSTPAKKPHVIVFSSLSSTPEWKDKWGHSAWDARSTISPTYLESLSAYRHSPRVTPNTRRGYMGSGPSPSAVSSGRVLFAPACVPLGRKTANVRKTLVSSMDSPSDETNTLDAAEDVVTVHDDLSSDPMSTRVQVAVGPHTVEGEQTTSTDLTRVASSPPSPHQDELPNEEPISATGVSGTLGQARSTCAHDDSIGALGENDCGVLESIRIVDAAVDSTMECATAATSSDANETVPEPSSSIDDTVYQSFSEVGVVATNNTATEGQPGTELTLDLVAGHHDDYLSAPPDTVVITRVLSLETDHDQLVNQSLSGLDDVPPTPTPTPGSPALRPGSPAFESHAEFARDVAVDSEAACVTATISEVCEPMSLSSGDILAAAQAVPGASTVLSDPVAKAPRTRVPSLDELIPSTLPTIAEEPAVSVVRMPGAKYRRHFCAKGSPSFEEPIYMPEVGERIRCGSRAIAEASAVAHLPSVIVAPVLDEIPHTGTSAVVEELNCVTVPSVVNLPSPTDDGLLSANAAVSPSPMVTPGRGRRPTFIAIPATPATPTTPTPHNMHTMLLPNQVTALSVNPLTRSEPSRLPPRLEYIRQLIQGTPCPAPPKMAAEVPTHIVAASSNPAAGGVRHQTVPVNDDPVAVPPVATDPPSLSPVTVTEFVPEVPMPALAPVRKAAPMSKREQLTGAPNWALVAQLDNEKSNQAQGQSEDASPSASTSTSTASSSQPRKNPSKEERQALAQENRKHYKRRRQHSNSAPDWAVAPDPEGRGLVARPGRGRGAGVAQAAGGKSGGTSGSAKRR